MKKIRINIIIILTILSVQTYCCDCPTVSFADQWNSHELIFKGIVINHRTIVHYGIFGNEYNFCDIKIQNIYKGEGFAVGDTISINTINYPCYFDLKNNSEYLVFTNPGELARVSICSASTEVKSLNNGYHPLYNYIYDSLEIYNSKIQNNENKKNNLTPHSIKSVNNISHWNFDMKLTLLLVSIFLNILLILILVKRRKIK